MNSELRNATDASCSHRRTPNLDPVPLPVPMPLPGFSLPSPLTILYSPFELAFAAKTPAWSR